MPDSCFTDFKQACAQAVKIVYTVLGIMSTELKRAVSPKINSVGQRFTNPNHTRKPGSPNGAQ
jgi:hypothetical protein